MTATLCTVLQDQQSCTDKLLAQHLANAMVSPEGGVEITPLEVER